MFQAGKIKSRQPFTGTLVNLISAVREETTRAAFGRPKLSACQQIWVFIGHFAQEAFYFGKTKKKQEEIFWEVTKNKSFLSGGNAFYRVTLSVNEWRWTETQSPAWKPLELQLLRGTANQRRCDAHLDTRNISLPSQLRRNTERFGWNRSSTAPSSTQTLTSWFWRPTHIIWS